MQIIKQRFPKLQLLTSYHNVTRKIVRTIYADTSDFFLLL